MSVSYAHNPAEFEAAFVEFIARCTVIQAKQYANSEGSNPELTYDPGRKYIRVVSSTWGQRSVFCFVDSTNGNVLKADGWKKPALNFARGNIFDDKHGTGRATGFSIQ